MNRLLKLLGIGTVLTGYGITTVFGGKEGDGKNNKNPEEQTPSNQITSPFPQVNAFPQTQYPPVNLPQQAKQPDPFQPSAYPFQTQQSAFQPQYPQANIPSQTQYQQPNIPSQPQFPQVNAFPQTTPPPSSQTISIYDRSANGTKKPNKQTQNRTQPTSSSRGNTDMDDLPDFLANEIEKEVKLDEFCDFIRKEINPLRICKVYDTLRQKVLEFGVNTLEEFYAVCKENPFGVHPFENCN